MENISIFILILFVATTFCTVWIFYEAAHRSKTVLYGALVWMLVQAILTVAGFYKQQDTAIPTFTFLIVPGIILALFLFLTKKGRTFIDTLNIERITLIHTIRVPIEITLYYMFLANLIPVLMTFHGNNFDIAVGITAPVVYYAVFKAKVVSKKILLLWNFISLVLLANIVVTAILSTKTPFQKLAFDHPNVGILLFPFVWLPSVVVPLVLISQLMGIRWVLKRKALDKYK